MQHAGQTGVAERRGLTHTPRLGSAPQGVSLAGESGGSLQPVASLAAHLTICPVGGATVAAPQKTLLGTGEWRAGADCGSKYTR